MEEGVQVTQEEIVVAPRLDGCSGVRADVSLKAAWK